MRVEIKPATTKGKKLTAVFYDGERKVKSTSFGSAGMSDFTKHGDNERKKRYLERHKKNEDWGDYKSAGSLSRHILWNKPTIKASVADYKKRFGLK